MPFFSFSTIEPNLASTVAIVLERGTRSAVSRTGRAAAMVGLKRTRADGGKNKAYLSGALATAERSLTLQNVDTNITHTRATRAATTQAATNAVMHTHELLKLIVENLDTASLGKLRSVSTITRTLVATRPSAPRTLFFKAIPKKEETQWILDSQTKVIAHYTPGEEKTKGDTWARRQAVVKLATPNPIVFARDPLQIKPLEHRFKLCETLRFNTRPLLHALTKTGGPGSSVHEMYVCQPPVQEVEAFFAYYLPKAARQGFRGRARPVRVIVKMKEGEGVKVKDLLEAFWEEVGRQGVPGDVAKEAYLKTARCAIWFKGVVFATKSEIDEVEGTGKGRSEGGLAAAEGEAAAIAAVDAVASDQPSAGRVSSAADAGGDLNAQLLGLAV